MTAATLSSPSVPAAHSAQQQPAAPTFIFAGGGSGGHLYPALAIIGQLQALHAGARARIVCSDRAIDAKVLADSPVPWGPIPAKPLGLRPKALGRFVWNWGGAVRASREIIRTERRANPAGVHVVAMGGFVAAPFVQAAHVEKAPITMVNLDAVPGKANRLIAWRVGHRGHVFTGFPVAADFAKAWTAVPPIVREAAKPPGDQRACRARLGLDPARPVLMITGGSQGAGSINDLLTTLARQHAAAFNGWQILHQTGSQQHAASAMEAYKQAGVPAVVVEFCREMGLWWGAAELAVSRAGAGNVAEAWAAGVPTVFMPYPYHRDNHQARNAALLVDAGAAVCPTDRVSVAANLNAGGPGEVILDLLAKAERRAALRGALGRLGPADGALRIARALLSSAGAGAGAGAGVGGRR